MYAIGMVSFTTTPKAINGCFAVDKTDNTLRLIIDAQHANLCFHEPPHVELPSPTHLSSIYIPSNQQVVVAKMDLSNFYHHIGMPAWMQLYFGLPSVHIRDISDVLLQQHGDIQMHPICTTLPMGFSHAVYIAQQIHNNVLYSSNALSQSYNVLRMTQPLVTDPVHALYIDDNCIIGTSMQQVQLQYSACMSAYQDAGLVAKPEKCVQPTLDPVEVLGVVIDNASHHIRVHITKLLRLLGQTMYLINKRTCSGLQLARLVGHWTWIIMLRRPTFAIIRNTYIFIERYKGRKHQLWPSVIDELYQLIAVSPLIYADISSAPLHILPASDASLYASGVVIASINSDLYNALFPFAVYNTKHYASTSGVMHPTQQLIEMLQATTFSTIISYAWRYRSSNGSNEDHINELELQSVYLMLRHLISRPSAHNARIIHLVDNTTALFCLRKGRTSSPKLIPVIRKIAVHQLAYRIVMMPVWILSQYDPADSPSRHVSVRSINGS